MNLPTGIILLDSSFGIAIAKRSEIRQHVALLGSSTAVTVQSLFLVLSKWRFCVRVKGGANISDAPSAGPGSSGMEAQYLLLPSVDGGNLT